MSLIFLKKEEDSETVIYIAVLSVNLHCSNLLVSFMPQDGTQQEIPVVLIPSHIYHLVTEATI